MRPATVSRFTILSALLVLIVPLAGQSQKRLIEMRDGKLQLPFLKNADWIRDYIEAQARATKTGQLIFGYFTRSYVHCDESIQAECGPLAEAGFKAFAEKVVPFCHITTRIANDRDQDLFHQKGGTTWPHMVLMDAKGKVLYTFKVFKVAEFEAGLADLRELADLQRRAATRERGVPFLLLKKQLELQHIEFPAAKKQLRRIARLSKAQKRELQPLLLTAEILYVSRRAGDGLRSRAKAGEKFFRMKKKGLQPTSIAIFPFWYHMLAYAEVRKDPELYELALDTLTQEFPKMKFPAERKTLRRLQLEHEK